MKTAQPDSKEILGTLIQEQKEGKYEQNLARLTGKFRNMRKIAKGLDFIDGKESLHFANKFVRKEKISLVAVSFLNSTKTGETCLEMVLNCL